MTQIVHSIPSVGQVRLRLFPPADALYEWLSRTREIERQNRLRHLGSLSQAHPGTRLARYDYCVAMLHFAEKMAPLAGSTNFQLSGIEFSSSLAALQSIALLWNIGHLPGTFAVEKGVYRFIQKTFDLDPLSALSIPHPQRKATARFVSQAPDFLRSQRHAGISRLLAIRKLADCEETSLPYKFGLNVLWPLISERPLEPSPRWRRLSELFTAIRHAAYLTLDCPFTGLQWLPSLPRLVDELVKKSGGDARVFVSDLSDILSPVERATYETIYHSLESREATAWVAELVCAHLGRVGDPQKAILRWSQKGLIRDLKMGSLKPRKLTHIACVRIRSHMHADGADEYLFEEELRERGISHAVGSIYRPWRSNVTLEPRELVLDAFGSTEPTARDVGIFLLWLIRRFEQLPDGVGQSDLDVRRRADLGEGYVDLLERAMRLKFGNVELRLEPWDLNGLGVSLWWVAQGIGTGVWASAAGMDDSFTRTLLRRPSGYSPGPAWVDRAAELEGLRKLRKWLRRRFPGAGPRRRWLLVLAGVRIVREKKDIVEFDGGIAEVSSRTGRISWWGLETKNGKGSPRRYLEKKLKALGVSGQVTGIGNKHAVVRLDL